MSKCDLLEVSRHQSLPCAVRDTCLSRLSYAGIPVLGCVLKVGLRHQPVLSHFVPSHSYVAFCWSPTVYISPTLLPVCGRADCVATLPLIVPPPTGSPAAACPCKFGFALRIFDRARPDVVPVCS